MRVATGKPWTLGEHFMMTVICAIVVIVTYAAMLYTAERKTQCIPKLCEESSGLSSTPDSKSPSITTGPTFTRSDASTWEVRTSTDQRDASWIPPLAD